MLVTPDATARNTGLARLATDGDSGGLPVQVETLDDELHGRSAAILKIDVEGSERAVLEGAARSLKERRLRHIIFEDHLGAGSSVMAHLLAHEYAIFSIGWTLMGPTLGDRGTPPAHAHYEAPSYLATLAPDDALNACTKRGWMALRKFPNP